jgi:hypothetical protein
MSIDTTSDGVWSHAHIHFVLDPYLLIKPPQAFHKSFRLVGYRENTTAFKYGRLDSYFGCLPIRELGE